jgi:hypothetical protein
MPVLSEDDLKALDKMIQQSCFIHDLQLQSFVENIKLHSSKHNSLGYEDFRRKAIITLLDAEGAPDEYAKSELAKMDMENFSTDEHNLIESFNAYTQAPKKPNRIELKSEYYEYSVMEAFVAKHRDWLERITEFNSRFIRGKKGRINDFARTLKIATNSGRLQQARSSGAILKSEFTSVAGSGENAIYAIDRTEEEIAEDEIIDVALDAMEKEMQVTMHQNRLKKLFELDLVLKMEKLKIAQGRLDRSIREMINDDAYPSPLNGIYISVELKRSK